MSNACPLNGSGPTAVRVEIPHGDAETEQLYFQKLVMLAGNPYEPVLVYDESSESPLSLGIIREDIAEEVERNLNAGFSVNSSYIEVAPCFARFKRSEAKLVTAPLDYTGWLSNKSFQRLARHGQTVSLPCVEVVVGYEAIEAWLTDMAKYVPGAKLTNLWQAVELLTDTPEGVALPA